jgi:7-carboxy-7-deazaguanine synthase
MMEIGHAGMSLVEITGGEPLLQRGVYPLIKKLAATGYKVLVETNGSLSIREIDSRAVVILDIKTPGSGMFEKMDLTNLDILKQTDEVKFVITNGADYEWAKDMIHRFNLPDKCRVLLSPAYGLIYPEDLARWMIEDRLQARLNLQLQKYIFGPERRGV